MWEGTRTGVRLAEARYNTTENYPRLLPSLLAKKVLFLDSKVQRSQFASLERPSDDLAAGEIAAQRHANAAVTSRKTPQPKWPTTPQPDMFARR